MAVQRASTVRAPHMEDGRTCIPGEWNDTVRDYPLHRPLHEFIREQCWQTPQGIALRGDQGELSYAEVERRGNQLAHWLRQRGVGAGSVVGLHAQRSWEMVVALLGTLKAGAAYLPLDPSYPVERLEFMRCDADCAVVLTQGEGGYGAPTPTLNLSRQWDEVATQPVTAPEVAVSPDALIYVLYTSGSTGKPKGVMIEHRAIVNRLLWMQERYSLSVADRLLQKTPYSFDVSVWEFFWPLMQGATLVIAPPDAHRDARLMVELIQRERISICHFVPSMLASFIEQEGAADCHSLRHVFSSGEALPYELTQRFFARLPGCELHNLYGPTEAAVEVSYWDCPAEDPRGIVPIGRPVPNTQLYVLDADGALAPPGVVGELHIGGVQLARGYLRREALTAERFIQHPELGRLYRTGDACRWLSDGSIEYRGRLDFQIKLHGLRIELGEIEAAALRHPAVLECVAALRSRAEHDARLVLYYVARRGQRLTSGELRELLRRSLPDHMIPQHVVGLHELPHLSNGKIDRGALPDPFARLGSESVLKTPPRTAAEKFVARLWQQLLGVESVGIEDRFFDLGGHSLIAVRAASALQREFAVKLPLRVILMDAVSQVALACVPASESAAPARSAVERSGRDAMEPLYFGAQRELFGVRTLAGGARRRTAVLICPSWGPEFTRCYRALYGLSRELAVQGFETLRFDYSCTGDSAGEAAHADVNRWQEDICTAADELRRLSGAASVAVLGIRLGGLLAAAALERGLRTEQLMLWDPVPSGAAWLAELQRLNRAFYERKNRYLLTALQLAPEPDQLIGFRMPLSVQAQLQSLQLDAPTLPERAVLLHSNDGIGADIGSLELTRLPDDAHWNDVAWLTTPWNSPQTLRQVSARLGLLP